MNESIRIIGAIALPIQMVTASYCMNVTKCSVYLMGIYLAVYIHRDLKPFVQGMDMLSIIYYSLTCVRHV